MSKEMLVEKAQEHLQFLCETLATRRVGSKGNQQAADYFKETMYVLGLTVRSQKFACIDWEDNGSELNIAGKCAAVQTSPYSLACSATAQLVCASTRSELEGSDVKGQILLLKGELCTEQIMPKNFTFYNPEEHQQFIALLEKKQPIAIITATGRNPQLAGGMYPFPLIEDGDFDIPCAFLKDVEGDQLAQHTGSQVTLTIRSRRIPSSGENVIVPIGNPKGKRIVITAHLDAKNDTPGALDNGTGVTILLLLGELLKEYAGPFLVELVALNGEDHYSAQGEKKYLQANERKFQDMLLNINLDAVGYQEGKTAYSFYNCPELIRQECAKSFSRMDEFVEGESWYQGDHSIFVQAGVPAMAITSEQFMYLTSCVTHTQADTPALVDLRKVVGVADAIITLIKNLRAD